MAVVDSAFRCAFLVLFGTALGWLLHESKHGEVRLIHNVDDGTKLNHGQVSIDVRLPDGVSFPTFAGGFPQWEYQNGKPIWKSATLQVEHWW